MKSPDNPDRRRFFRFWSFVKDPAEKEEEAPRLTHMPKARVQRFLQTLREKNENE